MSLSQCSFQSCLILLYWQNKLFSLKYWSFWWDIIGSSSGLSLVQRQAITWTNTGSEQNFSELWIGILSLLVKKMHLKTSSVNLGDKLISKQLVETIFYSLSIIRPYSNDFMPMSYKYMYTWSRRVGLTHEFLRKGIQGLTTCIHEASSQYTGLTESCFIGIWVCHMTAVTGMTMPVFYLSVKSWQFLWGLLPKHIYTIYLSLYIYIYPILNHLPWVAMTWQGWADVRTVTPTIALLVEALFGHDLYWYKLLLLRYSLKV